MLIITPSRTKLQKHVDRENYDVTNRTNELSQRMYSTELGYGPQDRSRQEKDELIVSTRIPD